MNIFKFYEKPSARISDEPPTHSKALTVVQAFSVVIASAIGFGGAGTGVGYGLGVFAPGYYRTVFANGQQPDFDPVQVGIGLGLTQGLLSGGAIGVVVLLALAWSRGQKATLSKGGIGGRSSDEKTLA